MASADDLQRANWQGSIPAVLSLSPMSLSSTTRPEPVHILLPRNSYLHVSLEETVRSFHPYAIAPISSFRAVSQPDDEIDTDGNVMSKDVGSNDKGENENSKIGTTDTVKTNEDRNLHVAENNDGVGQSDKNQIKKSEGSAGENNEISESAYPICWFQDEETGIPLRWNLFIGILYDLLRLKTPSSSESTDNNGGCTDIEAYKRLPWRICVHFTSYPETLPSLCKGIGSANTFNESNTANDDVLQSIFQHYLNTLKQSLYLQHNSSRVAKNMNRRSHEKLWEGIVKHQWDGCFREISIEVDGESKNSSTSTDDDSARVEQVPIRMLVDERPSFSRPCKPYKNNSKEEMTTIGEVLYEWLPRLTERKFRWCVQGIDVPLKCPIVEVWRGLCHPDRFLYITVVILE